MHNKESARPDTRNHGKDRVTIARLRMHQLARYLIRTLHWKPAYLMQAKTNAWVLSLPRERTGVSARVELPGSWVGGGS